MSDYSLVAALRDYASWEQFRGGCQGCAMEDAADEIDRLRETASFLCERLREHENELDDGSEATRQFLGHVSPALARMEMALKAPGPTP